MDPRINKLAKLLVQYSIKLKKGQLVKIQGEIAGLPLIEAVYMEALNVGANPYIQITTENIDEHFLKSATDTQMKFISPMTKLEINKMDALVAIWANTNTKYLSNVNPKRQALRQGARKELIGKLFKRIGDGSLNWVGTQFPTHADAQQAEMSLSEYEDFVYKAGHINTTDPIKHWKKVEKEQMRLARILNKVDQIHIRGKGTDLKLRVKGRKWVSCHGTENFPDGEIFTSPIENTAEGYISYSYPAQYGGRSVEGIRLEFKKGKVVAESADKNEDYLKAMLDMDKGARFLGEVAIGTNYEIKQATGNTLFDEKIGGSCHLACGASIPEAKGKNKSALHWDMVCDLKKGGEIEADGKLIYKNGKFLI